MDHADRFAISLDNHPFEILGVIGPDLPALTSGGKATFRCRSAQKRLLAAKQVRSIDAGRGGFV
jgi:hypothetical protein